MIPLISIITPLYNAEEYVSLTIESVLSQTYSNWELIIVDDHSTDMSYTIVEQYVANDKRIFLHKREGVQGGGSVCRNIGVQSSKGQYIIFLDSDDLLFPSCLENRIRTLEQNEDLDFCVFQMNIIYSDDIQGNKTYLTHKSDNYLSDFLSYRYLPWAITCPLWKASFFKNELGGFDERYPRLQDPELHTRALLVDNVKFKVYDDLSYLDCSYRIYDKKSNLTNGLKGMYIYAETMYEKLKYRSDSKECMNSLSILYDEVLKSYTKKTEEDMALNFKLMRKINRYFYSKEIISFKLHLKTLLFLFYIKLELPKNKMINSILSKLQFKRFYLFEIAK